MARTLVYFLAVSTHRNWLETAERAVSLRDGVHREIVLLVDVPLARVARFECLFWGVSGHYIRWHSL
ncbi:hypothetical protein B1756_05130 [Natrarchaeobaculum aegyptiacum]|uniref:Uncharacterized protein n=1 Tax=Natrarchaeobaculum aegyptiacum TaxID=745377 RepID=A0A2Z2HQ94_9EURY|nr:hypothetical protein B1756_05130 [Natrarchaeobaculum aegyptiacum]